MVESNCRLEVPVTKRPRLSLRSVPSKYERHSERNPKIVLQDDEDETDDVFCGDGFKENKLPESFQCKTLSMASSPPSPNGWNALSVESPVRRKLQAIGLRRCLEDSNRFCTLGQGGFGTVVFGTWKSNKVAIKILDDEVSRKSMKHELNAERLDHPNIVKILEVFAATEEQHSSLLVMEYVGHYNLRDVLQNQPNKCTLSFILRCASQLSSALHHCHQKGVVHLDLKPSNVLVIRGSATVFKLADFGCSRLKDEPCSKLLGTPGYQGPETLQSGYKTNPKSDIYSFGVILWQLLARDPVVYHNIHPHTIIFQVATNPEYNPEKVSSADTSDFHPHLKSLYRVCWGSQDKRPSAGEVIKRLKPLRNPSSNLSICESHRRRKSSLRV